MIFWIKVALTFFKRKKWLIIPVLIIALVLGLLSYFFFNITNRNKIVEGIVGTHEERDLPEVVLNLISKPLLKTDKTGKSNPELAESLNVNGEATLYTLKLKPNLFWADGKKVVASDIYINIADVEIKVIDERTLEFKLTEPFSPFPALLTKPILRKVDGQFGFELVGVGPYLVEGAKRDGPFVKKIDFKAHDKNLPEILITFFPNEKIAKTALKLGEVQVLMGVTDSSDLNFSNLKQSNKTNFNQLVTIFLNTQDPILSDENLRLALGFGSAKIEGEETAVTSLPKDSWAFNSNVKVFKGNPEKAREYLKKVEKGKDEVITLTATSSLKEAGEKTVEAWKNLGLKAVLSLESGIPQNFQALLITQNIPSDPDQYSLWHSTQKGGTNISRIASPRIDKDLEDGRKITDPETRKQKYQDFQKILLDQAPAIFLYFPKYQVVYMKKVEENLNKVLPIQLSNLN